MNVCFQTNKIGMKGYMSFMTSKWGKDNLPEAGMLFTNKYLFSVLFNSSVVGKKTKSASESSWKLLTFQVKLLVYFVGMPLFLLLLVFLF